MRVQERVEGKELCDHGESAREKDYVGRLGRDLKAARPGVADLQADEIECLAFLHLDFYVLGLLVEYSCSLRELLERSSVHRKTWFVQMMVYCLGYCLQSNTGKPFFGGMVACYRTMSLQSNSLCPSAFAPSTKFLDHLSLVSNRRTPDRHHCML